MWNIIYRYCDTKQNLLREQMWDGTSRIPEKMISSGKGTNDKLNSFHRSYLTVALNVYQALLMWHWEVPATDIGSNRQTINVWEKFHFHQIRFFKNVGTALIIHGTRSCSVSTFILLIQKHKTKEEEKISKSKFNMHVMLSKSN